VVEVRAGVPSKEFGSIGKDIKTSGLADTNILLSFTFYGELINEEIRSRTRCARGVR
jgi:hypothetical protein